MTVKEFVDQLVAADPEVTFEVFDAERKTVKIMTPEQLRCEDQE